MLTDGVALRVLLPEFTTSQVTLGLSPGYMLGPSFGWKEVSSINKRQLSLDIFKKSSLPDKLTSDIFPVKILPETSTNLVSRSYFPDTIVSG